MDARGTDQNDLSILERIEIEESTPAESIIGGEEAFFLPYKAAELRAIVSARIERAFVEDGVDECALNHGIREDTQR